MGGKISNNKNYINYFMLDVFDLIINKLKKQLFISKSRPWGGGASICLCSLLGKMINFDLICF